MKILYVITGLGMGGAETQVVALADKMAELGHEVSLISLFGASVVIPKYEKIKIFELNMIKRPLSFLQAYLKARKIIKLLGADVVHSHMVHANLFARFLRISTKMNMLVCTAHNTSEGGKVLCLTYRLTNFIGDVFTNVSQEAVTAFEAQRIVKKGEMLCISNGIDVENFHHSVSERKILRSELGFSKDKCIFIAVGRFNQQKDYPNMLSAFQKVTSENKNVHLLIVGDGLLRNEIEGLIDALKIKDKVTLLGVRNDIPQLMSAADIFVLSSAWEGFGLVVAEAMACQLPVVATDCGGVKEVVGGYGILTQPQDSDALAKNMMSLVEMPDELRKAMSLNAREHIIKNYGLNETVNKWIQLYSQ